MFLPIGTGYHNGYGNSYDDGNGLNLIDNYDEYNPAILDINYGFGYGDGYSDDDGFGASFGHSNGDEYGNGNGYSLAYYNGSCRNDGDIHGRGEGDGLGYGIGSISSVTRRLD